MKIAALVGALISLAAAPALAVPDLQVFRNGGVAGGSVDQVGTVAAGTPSSVIYTIINLGNSTLSMPNNAVTVGAVANGSCSVSMQPNVVVPANGSTQFMVGFTPTGGTFACPLSIASDDPDGAYAYTLAAAVTGSVGTPEIAVTSLGSGGAPGGPLESGDADRFVVPLGAPVPRNFVIQNSGSGALAIAEVAILDEGNATCTVTVPPASTIAAGGESSFSVDVQTLSDGPYACTVRIASSDSDEPLFDVVLTNDSALEVSYANEPIPSGGVIGVAPGDPRLLEFTVTNGSRHELQFAARVVRDDGTPCAGMQVRSVPATLAGNADLVVTVDLADAQSFTETCTLVLDSDDVIEPHYEIQIVASSNTTSGCLSASRSPAALWPLVMALLLVVRKRGARRIREC